LGKFWDINSNPGYLSGNLEFGAAHAEGGVLTSGILGYSVWFATDCDEKVGIIQPGFNFSNDTLSGATLNATGQNMSRRLANLTTNLTDFSCSPFCTLEPMSEACLACLSYYNEPQPILYIAANASDPRACCMSDQYVAVLDGLEIPPLASRLIVTVHTAEAGELPYGVSTNFTDRSWNFTKSSTVQRGHARSVRCSLVATAAVLFSMFSRSGV